METSAPLYEGKAKQIYATENPEVLLVKYKNSFTAFNGEKKAEIEGKGRLNNLISGFIFTYLARNGLPSHFIKPVDDLSQLVRKVTIVPLEVVVRNIATGSLVKNFGVREGLTLSRPMIGLYYKDDALGDPLVNEDMAEILGWATADELARLKTMALEVNRLLRKLAAEINVVLVDFKLEFGRLPNGDLILADEISPDTCRFWDKSTGDRLDKDRFRKDLGHVLEAYEEIWRRLEALK